MSFLVRSTSLTDYDTVARSVGLDPLDMLAQARIDPRLLLDPAARLPGGKVSRLLEASAQRSGAEDFGLLLAERREISNLGELGMLIRHQRTLGEVFESMARYVRFQNESQRLDLLTQGNIVLARLEFLVHRPAQLRQSVEMSLAIQHRVMKTLLGKAWQPLQVSFRHAAPRKLATHRRIFQPARLQFGADYDGIALRPADLALPVEGSNRELAQHVQAFLDGLGLNLRDRSVDSCRLMIKVLLPTGKCSADAVARQLGMDRRTLHRHLQREDSHYGQVLDAVRRELAPRYLAGSERNLHDIAQMLGFSEASALSRWFTPAFGSTLSEWRRTRGGG